MVELTRDVLEPLHCWKTVDHVPGQPDVTDFKRRARLHQAEWREGRGFPIGTHPYDGHGDAVSKVGSRLELDFARSSRANLISEAARTATAQRLATKQPHEMINEARLWCDLLSSMPLCFNLFGPLAVDKGLAAQAVRAWFPDAPGEVDDVILEWSPGRVDAGYLGNRTAFDAAVLLKLDDGTSGVIGIETKYHEHLGTEAKPPEDRLARYLEVSQRSGQFHAGAENVLVGSALQQIWQDHLLALSMLQHRTEPWSYARFVVVYPEQNPSFASGVSDYADLLVDGSTFGAATLESLLDAPGALPQDLVAQLRERYLW